MTSTEQVLILNSIVNSRLDSLIVDAKPKHPGTELKAIIRSPKFGFTNRKLAAMLGLSAVSVGKILNATNSLSNNACIKLQRAGLGSAIKWATIRDIYEINKRIAHE